MRQMQGVLGTKGVLLKPQPRQLQERYLERELAFHVASLTLIVRGISELGVDGAVLVGAESRLKGVAGFFAALGSLVWYRRADLASAAALGRMATTATIALAIAPAAGGSQLEWALTIQFPALAIFGFTFFDFIFLMTS